MAIVGEYHVPVGTATCYELAAESDGKRYLLAFTNRRGRGTLLRIVRQPSHAAAIAALCGCPVEALQFKFRRLACEGADIWSNPGGTVRVFWSGRTEREARCHKPLVHVSDVACEILRQA